MMDLLKTPQAENLTKRASTMFLQGVLVLIGIGVLAAMLWEPHLEGVNANAAFFEVYLDPFVWCVYLGAIPFFVGLYQGWKLLGYARHNKVLTQPAVNAMRTIKYCALLLAGAIVAVDVYIRINAFSTAEDAAGALALGIIATFASLVIAAAAAMFERVMQKRTGYKIRE